MKILQYFVSMLAWSLYGLLSAIQQAFYKLTGFDVFNPAAVRMVALWFFGVLLYFFWHEVKFWVKLRSPEAKVSYKDVMTWCLALAVVGISAWMGITTAAFVLAAFPVGGMNPMPILQDALNHGLHSGSTAEPGEYGAVTLGPAKALALGIVGLQAFLAFKVEPDWLMARIFPGARTRYSTAPTNATGNPATDRALAGSYLVLSFVLTIIDISMSAMGATYMGLDFGDDVEIKGSAALGGFVANFVVFAFVWWVNVWLLLWAVHRQLQVAAEAES